MDILDHQLKNLIASDNFIILNHGSAFLNSDTEHSDLDLVLAVTYSSMKVLLDSDDISFLRQEFLFN